MNDEECGYANGGVWPHLWEWEDRWGLTPGARLAWRTQTANQAIGTGRLVGTIWWTFLFATPYSAWDDLMAVLALQSAKIGFGAL